jgi:hypothetical protein
MLKHYIILLSTHVSDRLTVLTSAVSSGGGDFGLKPIPKSFILNNMCIYVFKLFPIFL